MLAAALTLFLPRRLEHVLTDLVILDSATLDPREVTQSAVDGLKWRELQTRYLHTVELSGAKTPPAMRATNIAVVEDLAQWRRSNSLLASTEKVAANCFYSNYYTLATTGQAGDRMFRDNATILDLENALPEDLILVRPRSIRVDRRQPAAALQWANDVDVEGLAQNKLSQLLYRVAEHLSAEQLDVVSSDLDVQALQRAAALRNHMSSQVAAISR